MDELSEDFAGEIQQAWHRFLQRTEGIRPDLHRYCRSLTRSIWDAEDLVQDALLRAFAKLGEFSNPIDNAKSYLFRIATNLWVDRVRRLQTADASSSNSNSLSEEIFATTSRSSSPELSTEVREAAKQLINSLAPQERAAFVLKDVLDFSLSEIATVLQTTSGAVKSALHRGRSKLAEPSEIESGVPASDALIDQFVQAFNDRDLDRLTALLLHGSVAEVVGMGTTYGRDEISKAALYYSLFLEKGEPQAERHRVEDESVVLFWYSDSEDSSKRIVREVLRIEESCDQVLSLRYYTFCPETLSEICGRLDLPAAGLGYGVWSSQFLSLRKEEEFLAWRAKNHPHWDEQAKRTS